MVVFSISLSLVKNEFGIRLVETVGLLGLVLTSCFMVVFFISFSLVRKELRTGLVETTALLGLMLDILLHGGLLNLVLLGFLLVSVLGLSTLDLNSNAGWVFFLVGVVFPPHLLAPHLPWNITLAGTSHRL